MRSDRFEDRRLQEWVDQVAEHWESLGLPVVVRQRLRDELTLDLVSALASGATVGELLTPEPADFAAEVAQSAGAQTVVARSAGLPSESPRAGQLKCHRPVARRRLTYRNLCATTLIGGVVGALLAWYFVYPTFGQLYSLVDQSPVDTRPALAFWLAMAMHTVAAAISLAVACAAVTLRFSGDPSTRRTTAFVAPLMSLFGAASVLPTMGLARFFSYSATPLVVMLEVLLVCLFLSGGIMIGRWLAVGRPRRRRTPAMTG